MILPLSTAPSLGSADDGTDLRIEAVRSLEAEAAEARRRGPRGSRLPAEVQAVVAEHLRAGATLSATARAVGVSREQVRTVRYAMAGLTLAEARALKRQLRVDRGGYVSVASLEGGLDVPGDDPDWFCS